VADCRDLLEFGDSIGSGAILDDAAAAEAERLLAQSGEVLPEWELIAGRSEADPQAPALDEVRARCLKARVDIAMALADSRMAVGDPDSAIPQLEALLKELPEREELAHKADRASPPQRSRAT